MGGKALGGGLNLSLILEGEGWDLELRKFIERFSWVVGICLEYDTLRIHNVRSGNVC